ncbi:unnamed protein product [Tetraodon nigroviridis]|uniref:(spotted green pufferfish) hypothetical protein n=1 Tax=Tetraodon nigroviridis TaxID=99883 RepID=Q4S651_TETNG|nr:unnamed protein product [Tetraodon nigroviridis]
MAVPMWRMNGVWKRMAGVLLLCALLLCNEVTCQDDAATNSTDGPAADVPDATIAPAAGPTGTFPSFIDLLVTNVSTATDQNGSASGTTAAPSVEKALPAATSKMMVMSCTEPEDIVDLSHVFISVKTADCEESKGIIAENLPFLCKENSCEMKLYQKGENLQIGTKDVDDSALIKHLLSEPLKSKLSSSSSPSSSSSSSSSDSSVFVGVLVSGLLAAAAITAAYCKCQRRSDTKEVKLAEEAYPVDQENQGNTLVSVAPLNPPPETPEKPSVNGESPEAVKTEPTPPTNGHSTSNTADTEM